jgi:hypothetical protein
MKQCKMQFERMLVAIVIEAAEILAYQCPAISPEN